MRRTAVLLLLSALLGSLGAVVAAPAQACECVGGTPAEYADGADAVFTGRLVSREVPAEELTTSTDPALHVFAVDSVIKGTVAERQEILSPMSGASCGLELLSGVPVVVFATRSADPYINPDAPPLEEDQYYSYLCDGSAPLTPRLEAELAALGTASPAAPASAPPAQVAPVPPVSQLRASATVPPDDEGTGAGILVAGAAVLLGAGAVLVYCRHRS